MDIAALFSHTTAGNEQDLRTLLDEHPFLLHVRNPKRSWDEGRSVLHCAAKYGHLDIVRLLVDRGAEVYSNPTSSYPPVIIAAWNKQQAVVDYFLNEVPDRASGTNKLGVTVTFAAREGWTDLVRRHIEADPLCIHQRGPFDFGYTPLHWSSHNAGLLTCPEVTATGMRNYECGTAPGIWGLLCPCFLRGDGLRTHS